MLNFWLSRAVLFQYKILVEPFGYFFLSNQDKRTSKHSISIKTCVGL